MRLSVLLLVLALLGCNKKIVEYPTQSHSFAAQDVCAQGPFSVNLAVPTGNDPHLLRLGFALETIPTKLFYQVKITASGKVLATGALEQQVEQAAGKPLPKNPCLGRTMPILAPANPVTPTPANSTSTAEGGYVLVIIPDARAPQMMWLNYQALTEKSPSIDVPLKDVPAASQIEVLFWSEEPYPLGKARIQASLIALKTEFVPDPERVQARKDRKEKRFQQQVEQALLQETERLAAAQARDAALARLALDNPKQKDFFEAERGRFILKFSTQWERVAYGKKYDEKIRAQLYLALSAKVSAFINSHQAQVYAYEHWKDLQRQDRKDSRKERRKDAVARYTKVEVLHLKRMQRRDDRLVKKQKALKDDSKEFKDLNIKRGKKIKRYDQHLRRFSKLTEARTFGRSRPDSYHKLMVKARDFVSSRAAQRSAYESWKQNKKYEREDKKYKREHERHVRQDQRATDRHAKQLEQSTKLAATWRERFERLKAEDEAAAKKSQALKDDAKKQSDYKRGKNLTLFRKKFIGDFYAKKKNRTSLDLWQALYSDVETFYAQRSAQVYVYEHWKEERKSAREKEQLAKKAEQSKKQLASWRERFERLKAEDEAAAKKSQALKDDAKKQSDYKRGKNITLFRKKFSKAMNKYGSASGTYSLWAIMSQDVETFYAQHAEQLYTYQVWKDEKARLKKEQRAKDKLAKKVEKSKKLAAAWKDRFASLKAEDEAAAKKSQGLKGDEQLALEAKRGKRLLDFQRRFNKDYNQYSYLNNETLTPWGALYNDVNAFIQAHQAQLSAKYAYEAKLRADKRNKKANARTERSERAVKKEAERFARLAEQDAQYAADYEKAPADSKARDAILRAWGKDLESYKKHFEGFVKKLNGKRYTQTSAFYELSSKVNALYAQRQSTINSAYVLKTNEPKHKKTSEERQRERREAKGGTHRALKRWEQAITDEKALLKQIEAQPEGARAKLQKQRRDLLEKEIAALFKVYNQATSEGKQYLNKAYQQATALQHDIAEVNDGPTPPPLPLPETPGPQPMAGAVWHAGYWKLENNKWSWKPGFWELPPGAVP